jgi:pyridoxal 5'-phosphate synthase pdxS subunit
LWLFGYSGFYYVIRDQAFIRVPSPFFPNQMTFEAPSNLTPTQQQSAPTVASFVVKAGLAQNLKGGVIMDVINADQARIAEEAGACAVMALERVPADIRRDGGVARMSDPQMIQEIIAAVTIPGTHT